MHIGLLAALLILWLSSAAVAPQPGTPRHPLAIAQLEEKNRPLWLVSNGFHSGLALRTVDAGPILKSAIADPAAGWVVIGWGDRDFYTAKKVTASMTLNAVFWPSASAVHVNPLRASPEYALGKSDVIRFRLSVSEMRRLRSYIERQFILTREKRPVLLGPGFFPNSRFYAGAERFYFPKMCNLWTARGLREGGIEIGTLRTLNAPSLVHEAARRGERVHRRVSKGGSF